MTAADGQMSPAGLGEKAWYEIVLQTLKRNDIRLVPYVPDRVLTRLIKEIARRSVLSRRFRPRARKKPSASSPAPGWPACAARC